MKTDVMSSVAAAGAGLSREELKETLLEAAREGRWVDGGPRLRRAEIELLRGDVSPLREAVLTARAAEWQYHLTPMDGREELVPTLREVDEALGVLIGELFQSNDFSSSKMVIQLQTMLKKLVAATALKPEEAEALIPKSELSASGEWTIDAPARDNHTVEIPTRDLLETGSLAEQIDRPPEPSSSVPDPKPQSEPEPKPREPKAVLQSLAEMTVPAPRPVKPAHESRVGGERPVRKRVRRRTRTVRAARTVRAKILSRIARKTRLAAIRAPRGAGVLVFGLLAVLALVPLGHSILMPDPPVPDAQALGAELELMNVRIVGELVFARSMSWHDLSAEQQQQAASVARDRVRDHGYAGFVVFDIWDSVVWSERE